MSHVVGVGAVGGFGDGWRGIGRALLRGERFVRTFPAIPSERDPSEARAVRLMSKSARLAAIALRAALEDASWTGCAPDAGYFLGVGAAAGDVEELLVVLRASLDEGRFSLRRFGAEGLARCNPMLTFQLQHSFTLSLGAVLSGVQGPNAAFFSRGAGTVVALQEALHALRVGDCERALVGGADTAHDPVTAHELERDGQAHDAAEGAAILALAAEVPASDARVESCDLLGARARAWGDVVADGTARVFGKADVAIWVASDPARGAALRGACEERWPGVRSLDARAAFGEALAAGPAIAWAAAVDLVASEMSSRAVVLSAGGEGDLGVVSFVRSA